ncbi:hypothetical protein HanRHA438_Chr15g0702811 [Helianthus annuus]|nr:hypothetical protein HanRHA438_Chr15g0702811 [Helianthus annuus]
MISLTNLYCYVLLVFMMKPELLSRFFYTFVINTMFIFVIQCRKMRFLYRLFRSLFGHSVSYFATIIHNA